MFVFLFKFREGFVDFVQRIYFVQRQVNNMGLFCQCLQDGLLNLLNGVGNKFEIMGFIKMLSGFDQFQVIFINKVIQREILILILFGYGYNEV